MQYENDGLTDALYNELGILASATTRLAPRLSSRITATSTRARATTRVAPRITSRAGTSFAARVAAARAARYGRPPTLRGRSATASTRRRPTPRRTGRATLQPRVRTPGCPEPHIDRLVQGTGVLARLSRIEQKLVLQALQRAATGEHRDRMRDKEFRDQVIGILKKLVMDQRAATSRAPRRRGLFG